MELKYKENCPHCGAEIYYSDNEKLVKCTSCGSKIVVAEFLREQQKIEQRLAEGEAAKAALENAKQEKQKAQDALCETVRALDGIQTDQQDQAEKIKRILEGLQSGSAVQDNMLSLLQTLQEGQKDETSFLNRLMQNVSSGQKTTDDKLKTIGEIAGQLLQNQNKTEDVIRVLEERLIGSEQEKHNLINEYENWSKNAHKEDLERLTKIRDYSENILNTLQGFDEKIDLLHAGLTRVEEAVKGFETKWEKDKRNKLIQKYRYAEKLQKERRFDEAQKYYQDVLINGGQDPEVYWRILMCHYCIEYQWDDEGNQIATILYPDLSDPSEVMERANLLEVLNDSEKEIKKYYDAKLDSIDRILDKYRWWQYKHEYDVFISVKQTVKSNGTKYYTNDYKVGLDLYDHLTSLGLKVFNSEKTKGPAGSEWEPYILAALMSARVMIVVGTCSEYMEAQWVKNEWSRYQWLQKREADGNRKRLLFCYLSGGMRAEDIPKGLNPGRQAIIDGIGAQAELDNALYNVFPQIGKRIKTGEEEQIISKLDELLANEEYEKAEKVYEEYRSQEAHGNVSVNVLLRVLCAKLKVSFVEDIPHVQVNLSEHKLFRYVKNCAKLAKDTKYLNQLEQMESDNLAELNKNISVKEKFSSDSALEKDKTNSALQVSPEEFIDYIKRVNSSKNMDKSGNEVVSASEELTKTYGGKQVRYDLYSPEVVRPGRSKHSYSVSESNTLAVPAVSVSKSTEKIRISNENERKKHEKRIIKALAIISAIVMLIVVLLVTPVGQLTVGKVYDMLNDDVQSLIWYKKSAEQGNADAQYIVGYIYAEGLGVTKDYAEAVTWYRKSAEQGNATAQVGLGYMYQYGYGVTKDYAEAVIWYRKSAEQGNKDAQYNLGYMYQYGYGVTKDYAEAAAWYRRSAEQGNVSAQVNLGYMYQYGYGVTKDDAEAVAWYRKSAEQGDIIAQYNLGYMYQYGYGVTKDCIEAAAWYRKSAEQGNATAQNSLGYMYLHGYGVTKDYAEAVTLFRKSVEQGNADAQYNLGYMYENGYGVQKDYDEAVKWYQKSAEQGNMNAQYKMGEMYQYGYGVTEDDAEAVFWYKKSAEQGNANAQFNLGYMYQYGYGVTKDYAEAATWYRKSAEQGNADAQYKLGYMYRYGFGVTKDYGEAVAWYRKSAEQGNDRAQHNLGYMYEKGYGVRQDYEEAMIWYQKSAEQGNTGAAITLKRIKGK